MATIGLIARASRRHNTAAARFAVLNHQGGPTEYISADVTLLTESGYELGSISVPPALANSGFALVSFITPKHIEGLKMRARVLTFGDGGMIQTIVPVLLDREKPSTDVELPEAPVSQTTKR